METQVHVDITHWKAPCCWAATFTYRNLTVQISWFIPWLKKTHVMKRREVPNKVDTNIQLHREMLSIWSHALLLADDDLRLQTTQHIFTLPPSSAPMAGLEESSSAPCLPKACHSIFMCSTVQGALFKRVSTNKNLLTQLGTPSDIVLIKCLHNHTDWNQFQIV